MALTAQEAKKMMEEHPDAIILDVRGANEFAEKRIPNSINIPNETIMRERPTQLPDLKQYILIYCLGGGRAKQAAKKLSLLGYENVYDFGGINNWPYEIEQ